MLRLQLSCLPPSFCSVKVQIVAVCSTGRCSLTWYSSYLSPEAAQAGTPSRDRSYAAAGSWVAFSSACSRAGSPQARPTVAAVSRRHAGALHCAAGSKFCSSCCRCHHFAAQPLHDDAHGGRPHAHSIHMLRPWFSSMLRIIIIVVGGLNMIRIAVVSGGPRCAPQLLPNEGRRLSFEGVHWRSLASNFGDFDDFGLNFVNFSCT